MTGATLENESNLWPSVLLFSVTYLCLSAVVTAVLMIFDIDANSGVAIGVLVAATAIAARKFVLDHRRALQRGEQLRFALIALIATILITLVQVAVASQFVGNDELQALIADGQTWIAANTGLLAIVVAAAALIYFAILYFTSGWFSRWFDKRLATTGQI